MKETKFKQTEVGMIPSDWEVKTFCELFEVLPNNTLSRAELNKEYGSYKNVHYGDILVEFGEWIDCSNVGLPFINSNAKFNHTVLQDGDIVIADTAEDETVGKSTEITNAKNKKIVSGLHTIPIRPKIKFAPKWLGYYINSACWHDQILPFITGTKVSAISKAAVSQTKLFFPAKIEEQQRIANALSDVDTLINNLEKLIAKKKNIKQGAMQQLLTGKKRLPGFAPDERTGSRPTDERRKECHSERSAKREVEKSSGYKMTEFGMIPSDWEVKTFGELFDMCTANIPIKDVNQEFYVGTENMLQNKMGVVKNTAVLPYSKVREYQKNDILVSNIRPYLKKIWFADKNGGCSTDVLVFRVKDKNQSPSFLYNVVADDRFFNIVNENAIGTKMPRGDKNVIKQILFAVPSSKAEQTAIANVLSDMDTEISALETKLVKYRTLKTGMMQQLLTGKIRLIDAKPETASVENNRVVPVAFKRAVLAAEIAHRLCAEPTFGHVKMEKMLFLAEKMCELDINSSYHRDAAGPYDNRALRSVDSQLEKQKWFKFIRSDKGNHYIPLEKRGGHSQYFDRYYSECRSVFDNIISTFKTAKTEQCEIVATLYSAWEDFLNQGLNPTDDQIVTEVLTNWNESKKRISKERWIKALLWMKENGFVPGRA